MNFEDIGDQGSIQGQFQRTYLVVYNTSAHKHTRSQQCIIRHDIPKLYYIF